MIELNMQVLSHRGMLDNCTDNCNSDVYVTGGSFGVYQSL